MDDARLLPANGRDWFWSSVAVVGLTLCLLLTGIFDTVLAAHISMASFDFRIAGSPLSGNSPVVATCVVCALLAWTMRTPWVAAPAVGACLAVFQALACVVLFFVDQWGWLAFVAWCVLQVAATVQLVIWAQTLAQIGRRRSLAVFACALLLDCLVNLGDTMLVPAGVAALCLTAALLSPVLLSLFTRALGEEPPLFQGASHANAAAPLETLPFVLSMTSLVLFGVAVGSIQSNGGAGPVGSLGFATSVQFTTALVAVALFVFARVFDRLPNPDATLRVFLLAVLLGAVYLVGALGASFAGAGVLVASIARSAIFAYIWVLACEALPHPTRAAFVFACGWGAFTLAQTVSTKLGLAVHGLFAGSYVLYNLLVVACFVGLVVITAYPQLWGKGDGVVKGPDAPEGPLAVDGCAVGCRVGADEPDLYARGCARLAERFDLTAREAEVLLPLVRGRSNSSIAASLTIGTETVRTHIRHIYQKTDIHSREELMDTVEGLGRR